MNAFTFLGFISGANTEKNSRAAFAICTSASCGHRVQARSSSCGRKRTSPCMAGSRAARSRAVAKHHAAAAMRGLSDTAAVAVLHELWHATVAAAAGGSVAGVAEACIAFGGLAGIWSAALAVRLVRAHARLCAEKARRIADDWDRSFLYHGAGQNVDDADEDVAVEDVSAVIAWMDALEELESPYGARLLWELARSSQVEKRCALAQALSSCENLQSNVVIGVLATLVRDNDRAVSEAATKTCRVVIRSNGTFLPLGSRNETNIIVCSASEDPTSVSSSATNDTNFHHYQRSKHRTTQQMHAVLEQRLEPERTRSLVGAMHLSARSGETKDKAESIDIVEALNFAENAEPCIIQKRFSDAMRVEAPLFDWLATAELRTLCAVASVPLAYELFYIVAGANGADGLRFVGLGWLMSVAGLLAYPRSDAIWLKVEETVAVDICECKKA